MAIWSAAFPRTPRGRRNIRTASPYTMRDGSRREANVRVHPDRRVQAVVDQRARPRCCKLSTGSG